jgi:hypothetical protein
MDTRLAPARPLTRADRCDRCSAAAQIRATLTFGELLFCGHHIRAYRDHLVSIGAVLDPPVDRSPPDW